MGAAAKAKKSNGRRRAILDLAPLELDCLQTLWSLGEASVRQVHAALQPIRPRAYTTIMTILDRLAQKGYVERRKRGRAWVYRPLLSAEQARSDALEQIVLHFFGGSREALLQHLHAEPGAVVQPAVVPHPQEAPPPEPPIDTTLL
ncbi:MAG: BlaI/MecI/CopY family transcriptional regulator [Firmicutes bacterium]|nr:BlaI/MecI/CopY family transcriptional regulator [Bacillota bacterium]